MEKDKVQKRVKKLVAEKNEYGEDVKALKSDLDLARAANHRSSKDNEELHDLLQARQELHEKQKLEIKSIKAIYALEVSKNGTSQSEVLKLKAGWLICPLCLEFQDLK